MTELTNRRLEGWCYLWHRTPKTHAPRHHGGPCLPNPTPFLDRNLWPTDPEYPLSPPSLMSLPLWPWLLLCAKFKKLCCCQGSTRAPILQGARTGCYAGVSVTQALLQSAKMLVQCVLMPKGGCVSFFIACCIPITSALGFFCQLWNNVLIFWVGKPEGETQYIRLRIYHSVISDHLAGATENDWVSTKLCRSQHI